MNNQQKNIEFFDLAHDQIKSDVLENIASHYCITQEEALKQVTDEGAEHLLDYITGPRRRGIYLVMSMLDLL